MSDLETDIETASRHLGVLLLRRALGGAELTEAQVFTMLWGLTPRQRAIILLRYGLDGRLPKTLSDTKTASIAEFEVPVSRERIRQIEMTALGLLRAKIEPPPPKTQQIGE